MRVACVLVTHLAGEGGDVPASPPERDARGDRRQRHYGDKAHGRRPFPQGHSREGRHDAGGGRLPPRATPWCWTPTRCTTAASSARCSPPCRESATGLRVPSWAQPTCASTASKSCTGERRGASPLCSTLLPAYLSPRVGVADAKFPAFVAAWTCGAHGAFRVPQDVKASFLASHSIDLPPSLRSS